MIKNAWLLKDLKVKENKKKRSNLFNFNRKRTNQFRTLTSFYFKMHAFFFNEKKENYAVLYYFIIEIKHNRRNFNIHIFIFFHFVFNSLIIILVINRLYISSRIKTKMYKSLLNSLNNSSSSNQNNSHKTQNGSSKQNAPTSSSSSPSKSESTTHTDDHSLHLNELISSPTNNSTMNIEKCLNVLIHGMQNISSSHTSLNTLLLNKLSKFTELIERNLTIDIELNEQKLFKQKEIDQLEMSQKRGDLNHRQRMQDLLCKYLSESGMDVRERVSYLNEYLLTNRSRTSLATNDNGGVAMRAQAVSASSIHNGIYLF